MTTPESARSYAEARISIINRDVAPLMEEKRVLEQFLATLPPAEPSSIQARLQSMAQQNPALRAQILPLLGRRDPVTLDVIPELDVDDSGPAFALLAPLSPYRREMFLAMGETFTRNDMFRWIHCHEDNLSTNLSSQTKRLWGAMNAFRTLGLIHVAGRGKFLKRIDLVGVTKPQ